MGDDWHVNEPGHFVAVEIATKRFNVLVEAAAKTGHFDFRMEKLDCAGRREIALTAHQWREALINRDKNKPCPVCALVYGADAMKLVEGPDA